MTENPIKSTFLAVVFAAAATLVACGGGSDNGSQAGTPSPTPTAAPAASETPACTVTGKTVTVPKDGSCTHSNPALNKGQKQTFTCSNGTVKTGSGGAISTAALTVGDFTYQCAP